MLISREEAVRKRLLASGLSYARDEDVAWVIAEFESKRPSRGVWKREDYLAILNEEGLKDPKLSWSLAVKPCNGALATIRNFERQEEAGIELVKFRFGGMLAGHCTFSREMDGKVIALGQAEPLPSMKCEHPDQCGCIWQGWIKLMDELGIE